VNECLSFRPVGVGRSETGLKIGARAFNTGDEMMNSMTGHIGIFNTI
jgi:hypothetical protein